MSTPKDSLETAAYEGSRVERSTREVEDLAKGEYKYGWTTDIETDTFPKGLNEDIIRAISARKQEPEWMLEWRLKAYRNWLRMDEPNE